MEYTQPANERARTKIVATVGPACESVEQLSQLMSVGADVFRINTAHGKRDDYQRLLENVRAAAKRQERLIGVLVDLAGPKIRLGTLVQDPLQCDEGVEFDFIRGHEARNSHELTSTYELLLDELQVGDRVLLADGTVSLVVIDKQPDRVRCKVISPGEVRSRQGVNLPGVKLSVPSLSETDRGNAEWAAKAGADFVSLSFVRTAVEVRELSSILRKNGSSALVIAKIEKPEALENLDEIVAAAGGVMVARGDLGVEIDVAQTPIAQKRIIETCTRHNKPVIVATQMLDSMQHSRRPTRAEASDVANAILDGADACMLSGETAIGDYPREAVEMMNRIMLATEGLIAERPAPLPAPNMSVHPITGAIVFGAARIAERLKAKMIVVATRSGRTALAKAKLRAFTTTLGVSSRETTLRQMTLFWGIEPVFGAPDTAGPELREFAENWGRTNGLLSPGDRIVIVAGTGYSGAHNQLEVHEVR